MHAQLIECPVGAYTDANGAAHVVLVDLHSSGVWQVIDRCDATAALIERLTGVDDSDEQAVALACSYLQQVAAYLHGERDDMPCPHPAGNPLRVVGRAAAAIAAAA